VSANNCGAKAGREERELRHRRLPERSGCGIPGICLTGGRRRHKGCELRAVLILAGFVSLASCGPNVAVISSGERYSAPSSGDEYKLGAGDRLRVTVFNEPNISGIFQVDAHGKLSLPLVGEIEARGRTAAQVASEVQGGLGRGFLKNPSVSAEISDYRPFFILGEVVQSGQYPYVPGMTATSAIATARGFTPRSQRRFIFIQREGESVEAAYRVAPGLRIYPGDTIRIEERWF
jgi:polysaccharide export outer membrane protein